MPAATPAGASRKVLPGYVTPRLAHLYEALYAGTTNSGGDIVRPTTNLAKVMVLGDSVGGAKPQFIIPALQAAFGDAGGMFMNTPAVTGAASVHTDVNDGSVWFNGQWVTLTGGGSAEYLHAGGRPAGDVFKVYYVKEPGAGTFKVQTNTGAGYADEAGYTNVSAANASAIAGVITLNKAAGTELSFKLVSLTGTVKVIGCAYLNATNGGVASFRFDVGGLEVSAANQAAVAVVQGVMADIAPDLVFQEWKDNTSFPSDFATFMGTLTGALTATDWVMIGTTPESVFQSYILANNAAMKSWADSNGGVYFDSYSPLTYAQLVALGWNGDGTHLSVPANAFYATLLMQQLGLDRLVSAPNGPGGGWRVGPNANGSFAPGTKLKLESRNIYDAEIYTDDYDLIAKGGRGFSIRSAAGDGRFYVDVNGGNGGGACVNFLILADPGTSGPPSGPAIRPLGSANNSGAYSSGYGGGGAAAPFGASKFIAYGGSGNATFTSGDGVPTANEPNGSLYSRLDAGAGSTLYLRKNGAWVAVL